MGCLSVSIRYALLTSDVLNCAVELELLYRVGYWNLTRCQVSPKRGGRRLYHLIFYSMAKLSASKCSYVVLNYASTLHIKRFSCRTFNLIFSQVHTTKRMIAFLFRKLLVKIHLIAVLLLFHAGLYHKHYGWFAIAERFVLMEGTASPIHMAV